MNISTTTRRNVLTGLAGTGVASAALPAFAGVQAPRDPDLGDRVTIIDPAMPPERIQAILDAIFRQQESAHFTDARYAVLFKPGRYAVDVNIGFFTQVAGLGLLPDDVTIDGHVHVEADWAHGMALDNFWRSAENLAVRPRDGTDRWAVSQAAPYRRIHLHGDLALDDGGWSSGGFMADCRVEGTIRSGTQQQWFTRSGTIGGWEGANWNMVFAGVAGAPPTRFPNPPITNVAAMPGMREKPFLHCDAKGEWVVFVPAMRHDAQGTSWEGGKPAGRSIPLSRFLIAKPDTPASRIDAALANGFHLLLTPGIYRRSKPLRITRPGTVILGLGLATLLATDGNAVLTTANVPGVTVAGLLIDAGPIRSPVLMQIGEPEADDGRSDDPTLLADIFFRVGGTAIGRAGTCLEINSHHVLCDDLWIWRADHGDKATARVHVGWTESTGEQGLVVNGDDVAAYGLFVEHFQRHQVVWNGERGRTLFYQSELPYDPPSQAAYGDGARRGWSSYKVSDRVQQHHATGLGIYANFTADPTIVVDSAIVAPDRPGIGFDSITTIALGGGKGTIAHLVNDTGPAARAGAIRQTLVRYPER